MTGTQVQGARNAHGLTHKQETFAQEVAKGATQSEAYRKAYDCSNMKPATVWSEGSKMMDNPQVAARIGALLEQQEERMLRDAVRLKRHVLTGLLRESEDFEKGNAMSRIRALELIGKTNVVGLFREAEASSSDTRKPEDIEAELRQRMRDMFMAGSHGGGNIVSGTDKPRNDDPGEAGAE